MKTLPTLFKKTSTGAIQFWKIEVHHRDFLSNSYLGLEQPSEIVTKYGQLNTDSPQETSDWIKEGKNAGKKNATTAYQQAELEAEAKWEKQLKKGYVTSLMDAESGKTDAIIEGGVVPMLAHKFAEQAHKIKYPAFVQPKLDGIRCVAIVKAGKATLWSRTRKPITSCPHIIAQLEEAFPNMSITFDGELYNHSMKADFEKIVSLVRQEEPGEGHEIVEYHVYDMVSELQFKDRISLLTLFLREKKLKSIKPVMTEISNTEDDVMTFFSKYRDQGYEGAMLRNGMSLYVNKRSYDLQKVKEFDDGEFPITGIEEGRGKLAGHAIFVCKTETGSEFKAKLKGDTEMLKKYFENPLLWQNKQLTVKYQGKTNKEGVPRFPVGIAVRDYE